MGSSIAIVAVIALVTMGIRALPFLVFRGRDIPKTIKYLGDVLPTAIMITLVVYCLKGIHFMTGSHGLPELISVAVVVLIHVWKRNTLLSIAVGTILYMILVQLVFV